MGAREKEEEEEENAETTRIHIGDHTISMAIRSIFQLRRYFKIINANIYGVVDDGY